MDYTKYFKTKKRDNRDTFIYLEGAPQKLVDLVHEIDKEINLNNSVSIDWTYKIIYEAIDLFGDDNRDLEDIIDELQGGDILAKTVIYLRVHDFLVKSCDEELLQIHEQAKNEMKGG